MVQNRKVFYVIWLVHILLTAVAGAAVIWVNATAIKLGIQADRTLDEILQFCLNILLFPIKPILGEWLTNSDSKWLFVPAVIVNSFTWAFGVALVARTSSASRRRS